MSKDKQRAKRSIELFSDDNRGVSQIIAVALLILVAVGFVVAIEEVGTNFLSSVEQPPDASIEADPSDTDIRLTVQSVENTDELSIQHNGENINDANLSPSAGNTTVIQYSDISPSEGDQISVTATDTPDNTAVVFRYEVPEGIST